MKSYNGPGLAQTVLLLYLPWFDSHIGGFWGGFGGPWEAGSSPWRKWRVFGACIGVAVVNRVQWGWEVAFFPLIMRTECLSTPQVRSSNNFSVLLKILFRRCLGGLKEQGTHQGPWIFFTWMFQGFSVPIKAVQWEELHPEFPQTQWHGIPRKGSLST